MKEFYFAYGSNMNPERLKERRVIFSNPQKGILVGYKLIFQEFLKEKEYNVFANIKKEKNSIIEGVVYEIKNIEKLDYFEYTPRDYIRRQKIILVNNNEIKCWVYIGNNENIGKEKKPNWDYLKHFLNNKLLSKKYINFLKTFIS